MNREFISINRDYSDPLAWDRVVYFLEHQIFVYGLAQPVRKEAGLIQVVGPTADFEKLIAMRAKTAKGVNIRLSAWANLVGDKFERNSSVAATREYAVDYMRKILDYAETGKSGLVKDMNSGQKESSE